MDSGADQVYHIHHVLYIPKAIRLADNQLDFVVGRFNTGVAQSKPDGIQDMILVPPDLFIQIMKRRYSAVACPPEPVLQIGLSLCDIGRFQKQAQRFLQAVCPVQLRVICLNHIQSDLLILRQMLRSLAERIG